MMSYYKYDRPSLELETVDEATHRYRWHSMKKVCYWDDVRAIAWEDVTVTRDVGDSVLAVTLIDGETLTIDGMDTYQFIYLLIGVPADFVYEDGSVSRIVPGKDAA